MSISAKRVSFDDTTMWVELSDARIIGVPLARFPRLLNATEEQRAGYELSARGIHWDALDEDVSVDGLLKGRGDVTHRPHNAARHEKALIIQRFYSSSAVNSSSSELRNSLPFSVICQCSAVSSR